MAAENNCVNLAGFILLLISVSECFNIAINSSRLVELPTSRSRQGQQFGYSVSFKQDQTVVYLLIGAPKAENGKAVRSSGATYRLPLVANVLGDPELIRFERPHPPTNQLTLQNNTGSRIPIERRDFQRLGQTIATPSLGADGTVLTCAPNYLYNSQYGRLRQPIGNCHIIHNSRFTSFSPCREDVDNRLSECYAHDTRVRCNSRLYVESLGYCQAGFSASFTPHGEALVVGAPGAEGWHGGLFVYGVQSVSLTTAQSTHDPANYGNFDDKRNFQYLGYSVAFGELNNRSDAFEVIASAPRYADEKKAGVVYLYEQSVIDGGRSLYQMGSEKDASYPLFGQQHGSYFGYKILAFDINGDRIDDIVISAPTYTDYFRNQNDVGCVYVFLQTKRSKSAIRFDSELVHVLQSSNPRAGARFGHSIANAGDLNGDGYADLLIGEPYGGSDGNGAVHLFTYVDVAHEGYPVGIRCIQTLMASEVSRIIGGTPLRSFGFSVAANRPLNADETAKVLIGAPESDKAILLLTSRVVHVITRFKLINSDTLIVNPENTTCRKVQRCFNLQVCSILTSTEVTSVSVTVTFTADSAIPHADRRVQLPIGDEDNIVVNEVDVHQKKYLATLRPNELTCWETPVLFKAEEKKSLEPMRMQLNYTMIESRTQSPFPPLVIDKFDQTAFCEVQIAKDCSKQFDCLAEFYINAKPDDTKLLVDSNKPIRIIVSITNRGEAAYGTQLLIEIPIGLHYQDVHIADYNQSLTHPPSCLPLQSDLQQIDSLVVCSFGVFPKTDDNQISVTLQFSALNYNESTNKASMEQRTQRYKDTMRDLDVIEEEEVAAHFNHDNLLFAFTLTSATNMKSTGYRNDFIFVSVKPLVDTKAVITGLSSPEQLMISHNSKALKNVTKFQHLAGYEVSHKYELSNLGKTRVAEAHLVVRWPLKLSDSYVFYPTELPIITRGNGFCAFNVTLDPLGLRVADLFEDNSNKTFNSSTTRINGSTAFETPKFRVNFGSNHQEDAIDCENAQCVVVNCRLFNLTANAIIELRAFIWWPTILKSTAIQVKVTSDAKVQIVRLASVRNFTSVSASHLNADAKVTTFVLLPYDDTLHVPFWVIVLSVAVGVALFAMVVLMLISCGFFIRERPPSEFDEQNLQEAYTAGQLVHANGAALDPNNYMMTRSYSESVRFQQLSLNTNPLYRSSRSDEDRLDRFDMTISGRRVSFIPEEQVRNLNGATDSRVMVLATGESLSQRRRSSSSAFLRPTRIM